MATKSIQPALLRGTGPVTPALETAAGNGMEQPVHTPGFNGSGRASDAAPAQGPVGTGQGVVVLN